MTGGAATRKGSRPHYNPQKDTAMTRNDDFDTRPERPSRECIPVTTVEFNDASDDNYGSIVGIAMLAILIGGIVIYLVS